MRKTIKLLVTIVFIVVMLYCVQAFADPGSSCGPNAYWTLNEDTGELIISGSGKMNNCPWSTNGAYSDSIISVNIDDGITNICDYAFQGCRYMTNITIPQSVTSIGSSAFMSCESIQSITIPGGVTTIDPYTFYNCGNNNTAVYLPENITSVAKDTYSASQGAFTNYQGSIYCKFGSSTAKALGKYADYGMYGSGAGYSFRPIDNPDVRILDASASSGAITAYGANPNAVSITVPEGVTRIDPYAFSGYTKMKSIILPSTLKGIDSGTFDNCSALESLTLPSNFSGVVYRQTGLSSLRSVHFPKGVYAIIDEYTWGSCGDNACYKIDANGAMVIWGSGDMWDYTSTSPFKDYRSNVNIRNITVEENITSIGNYAFAYQYYIQSIILPEGINQLGKYAFSNIGLYASESNRITRIDIPSTVKIIDSDCFRESKYLTRITIPYGVETIGARAFSSCSGISQLTIPTSVQSVGARAFANCQITELGDLDGLQKIDPNAFTQCDAKLYASIGSKGAKSISKLGDSFTFRDRNYPAYQLKYFFDGDQEAGLTLVKADNTITKAVIPATVSNIGTIAFNGCTALSTLTIQNKDTVFEDEAFSFCSNLSRIIVPGNLTNVVDESVFIGCDKLTTIEFSSDIAIEVATKFPALYHIITSFVLSDNVATIGESAFRNCDALTSINIPNTVTNIGDAAFYGCSHLQSATLPTGRTTIPESLFENCTSLAGIELPSGLLTIGYKAFSGCAALTEIVIPTSVTSIDSFAFGFCSNLAQMTVSGQLDEISTSAFSDCSKLKSITFTGEMTIQFPTVYPDLYRIIDNVTFTESTDICDSAFSGCVKLRTVSFPDTITTIQDNAFDGCKLLTNLILPDSIEEIGQSAFNGCISLNTLVLPQSLQSIGNAAFMDCSALTMISIPGNEKSIGENAFAGCTQLKSVHLLSNAEIALKEVYPDLATQVTVLTVENGVKTICSSAFADCEVLQNVTLPASMRSIGEKAFENCIALSSMTVPGSLDNIKANAFSGCTSLSSFTISGDLLIQFRLAYPTVYQQISQLYLLEDVTQVRGSALLGCSSLEMISVAAGNTSYFVENDVLYRISPLTFCCLILNDTEDYQIPTNTTNIGNYAFALCPGLKTINIPDSVTTIADAAFDECNAIIIMNCNSYAAEWSESFESERIQLVHDWNAPGYIWSEDNSEATATRTCTRNENHVDTETVATSAAVTQSPTQDKAGCVIYSAIFTNTSFSPQTKAGDVPSLEGMATLTLPTQLIKINEEAFAGINSEAVIIPNGCERIEQRAFAECNNLKYVYIPATVTFVADDAFDKTDGVILDYEKDHIIP